jgi:hypothetical protein
LVQVQQGEQEEPRISVVFCAQKMLISASWSKGRPAASGTGGARRATFCVAFLFCVTIMLITYRILSILLNLAILLGSIYGIHDAANMLPQPYYDEMAVMMVLIALALNSFYFLWQTKGLRPLKQKVSHALIDDLEVEDPDQYHFKFAYPSGIVHVLMGMALVAFGLYAFYLVFTSTNLFGTDYLIRFAVITPIFALGIFKIIFTMRVLLDLQNK